MDAASFFSPNATSDFFYKWLDEREARVRAEEALKAAMALVEERLKAAKADAEAAMAEERLKAAMAEERLKAAMAEERLKAAKADAEAAKVEERIKAAMAEERVENVELRLRVVKTDNLFFRGQLHMRGLMGKQAT